MNADYAHMRSQRDIIELYRDLICEARRLAHQGVIVKCKDTTEHGDYIEVSYYIAEALRFHSFRLLDKALLVPANQLVTDPEDDVHHFRRQESYFFIAKPTRRPG